jgi:hypothetical protein
MTRAIEKMDTSRGVEKFCWIMDFSEYGNRAKDPESKKVSQTSIHILQDHFPERLGLALIINAPWYMYYGFKVLQFLMQETTRSKIKWVYGAREELQAQLGEYIAADQLEEKYPKDKITK